MHLGIKARFAIFRYIPRLTGRRNFSPTNFPYLVWFANPADPRSAKEATLATLSDVLGPTVHVTDANVEITGDPIRIDIDKALPWLPAMTVEQKRGAMTGRPNQFQLIYSVFCGRARDEPTSNLLLAILAMAAWTRFWPSADLGEVRRTVRFRGRSGGPVRTQSLPICRYTP